MKKIIELDLGEGQRLNVETEEVLIANDRVSTGPAEYMKRQRDFGEAISVIRPLLEKVIYPLKTLKNKPKEVELEFGFRFGVDAEVILTSDQKEASLRVKLRFDDLQDH